MLLKKILQIRSVGKVDSDIAELNSTEKTLKSNNQCYVEDINRMTADIEEFGKTNESIIVELVEKHR